MEYRLLGPLEVIGATGPISLGGPKQRAVFALLLLNANRVVSRERFIDQLWPSDPPETAVAGVQVYISQLRKTLPPGTVVTRPPGYLLEADPEAIDLIRFEQLVDQAHKAVPERAAALLRQALELWRGQPQKEFDEPFARIEAGRLDELRLAAVEERVDADLTLGRHAELIGELEVLISEYPQRERLRANLMVALYRSGRQADALAAYQDARGALDELGLDASDELQLLESQILNHDEALALKPRKTNLRPASTPLVGRTEELADVVELVREHRLVTLTGAGGSGTTRLALEAVRSLGNDFADGVWLVSLGALSDPELAGPTIAQTLEVRGDVNDFLRGRQILLLLDNLEQLLPDIARSVAALETTVLATSRERLNVSDEYEYPVPTLQLDDAAALFTQRARQVEPRFEPDEHVTEIARRLDGLPLALELAAPRVKTLTPAQIADRVGQSLDLLTGGGRDRPERQRTLRGTLEWSHRLLDAREQSLFARLAVFVGGCTLDAAEKVAGAKIDELQSLVDKNLLQHRDDRFHMLETVRELALEKLELLADANNLRRRHAEYLLKLRKTPVPPGELARWHAETDNLRAAVEWALDGEHAELALQLARFTTQFQLTARECGRWLDRGLEFAGRVDPNVRATALIDAAQAHFYLGDADGAETFAQQGLKAFGVIGDVLGQSRALEVLGLAAVAVGDYELARERFERSLEVSEQAGNASLRYPQLHGLGEIELRVGNIDRARTLLRQALVLARNDGSGSFEVQIEHGLGDVALLSGDVDTAERHYLRGVSLARDINLLRGVAICLAGLSAVAAERGDSREAGRLWGTAQAVQRTAAGGIELLAVDLWAYRSALARVADAAFEEAARAAGNADPDIGIIRELGGDSFSRRACL
jgi:predicted ATPase/DNA-binding SARP family transcriptional activator